MTNILIDMRFEDAARKAWKESVSKDDNIIAFQVDYEEKYQMAKISMRFADGRSGMQRLPREDFDWNHEISIPIFMDELKIALNKKTENSLPFE